MAAYRAAFSLLPELVWMGHSVPACHDIIHTLNVAEATSTAISTCINLSLLSFVVEVLEQGLGIIFQQMLQLRTPLEGLPQAQTFQQLSIKLYSEGSDDSMNIVNRRNAYIVAAPFCTTEQWLCCGIATVAILCHSHRSMVQNGVATR
jgi:hypothetical protein